MYKRRDEHCIFKKLNPAGRCIAYCHYNRGPVDRDCTGKTGKTVSPDQNDPQTREIKT